MTRLKRRFHATRLATLFALAFGCISTASSVVAAQVGSTTDIIVGTVRGPEGQVMGGVRVEATSIETGVTRAKTTNEKGEFTILFPDGGGQYRITVKRIGFAPYSAALGRQADEDRLSINIRLSLTTATLAAVTVRASAGAPRIERPEPGGNERLLTGQQLSRLPIDPSDPNALALLQPGVVGVSATDSSGAGFSVAGQRPDQNQVTLDGLTFGAGSVPQEAVRTTRVVTSTYDIARGQFTGGQVSTTTRGGTNLVSASMAYSLRDPRLEWTDDSAASAFTGAYTQHQISGGFGGPIIQDKLFYFGSAQVRRRYDQLQSLIGIDARTLQSFGIAADSETRFIGLVQGYGVPLTLSAVPSRRTTDNTTGIVRVDYHVSDDHTLMFRGDWQTSGGFGSRINALSLPTSGGIDDGNGGGGMLTLTSAFGTVLNELRGYYSVTQRSSDPYLSLPSGRVTIASQLGDGSLGLSSLSFGGNGGLPNTSGSRQLEMTDEASWLVGSHRWKLGGLVNSTSSSQNAGQNRNGLFTYNSLVDFAANRPASFTRALSSGNRTNTTLNAAVYAGDSWRRGRNLQVTYGLRAEATRYGNAPSYNRSVDSVFGRRTNEFPSEFHVSPRVGFTWMLGGLTAAAGDGARGGGPGGGGPPGGGGFPGGGPPGGGPPGGGFDGPPPGFGGGGPGGRQFNPPSPLIIRGGMGEFRGRAPAQLFGSAQQATGLASGEIQLSCVGAAVPTPNWSQYLADPASVPTTCADGGTGTPLSSSATPNVTTFAPNFVAPRSWRASLGASKRLLGRYNANIDFSYALGTALYGVRDLNLDDSPRFTLGTEGGRPVYAPASSIVPTTGATTIAASRRNAAYGYVLDVGSELQSRTGQATASVSGALFRQFSWSLAYTWSRSLDQSSFSSGGGFGGAGGGFGGGGFAQSGFSSAPTSGNPNELGWATSDFERRHAVNGSLTWSPRTWVDVTSILRISSGSPYSPRVNGDVNGDGARNDLAFVFSPSTAPDTALSNGMARLLAAAPAAARQCLESQIGHVVARNSCHGEWTPSFDLQANVRPYLGDRMQHRVQFSVSFLNTLSGLDQLLHGANNLHGWGQPAFVDQTLLNLRGFDPTQQRYLYTVNERFGSSAAGRSAIRQPFQIGLQGTLSVGANRERELLPGGASGFDVASVISRVAPDPTASIIAMRDSLKLTDVQVAALLSIADSLRVENDSLSSQVQRTVDKAGSGADLASVFGKIQPALQQARTNYLAAIARAQRVLTDTQWQMLPEFVRNPTMIGPAGSARRPPAA